MTDRKIRIYCSGPLFNESERNEMGEIAAALEAAGFETFLPHRDGLEFKPLVVNLMGKGLSMDEANVYWDRAIFALDAYQVTTGCDGAVVNLNGRVPDEGAVSEAAMAYAAGRKLMAYKDDVRSLVFGRDNAMVVGLFGFSVAGSTGLVVAGFREYFEKNQPAGETAFAGDMAGTVELGREIWKILTGSGDLDQVADLVLK